MQDIHPIGGGGGRFYGGTVGGDRRLRPSNHQNLQSLKCPRCDSINTKFCYYNNYNLSQPRHFCKSCRRYWTKGGVLRNVPVGGGCRKSKRSKPKAIPPSNAAAAADATEEPKSNSHSSSESSSLTATTTAAAANIAATAAATTTEVVSATSSNSASTFLNFTESNFFQPNSTNPTYDHQPLIDHSSDGQIFQDIGNFTNIMTSSNSHHQGFNMIEIPAYRLEENPVGQNQNTNHEQWSQQTKMMETDVKMEQIGTGFMNQTAGRFELTGQLQQSCRVSNSELASLDNWQNGNGEHGMYDLTGTVDLSYWSQTQWGESDHSLNFLP